MKFQPLQFFILVSLGLLASHHAAVTSEVYWNTVLPNTAMPKIIKDLLPSGTAGDGFIYKYPASEDTSTTGPKNKAVHIGVTESPPVAFLYNYAANDDQLHDSANVALFFTENNLIPGLTKNLHFVKTTGRTALTLLPRKVSESIPFSTKYIPEIYEKFSVAPDSKEAEIIKKTISECEEAGIKGEEKYCATSLESMIDFTISKLGKHVNAISTEAEEKEPQKYTITGVKKVTADNDNYKAAVVCHKLNYAYAVFYCHKTEATEAYKVSLVGADGTTAKAVAVCHKDTSEWNPKHLAFQVLKVKPGTIPVCHFLPEDHIVWINTN